MYQRVIDIASGCGPTARVSVSVAIINFMEEKNLLPRKDCQEARDSGYLEGKQWHKAARKAQADAARHNMPDEEPTPKESNDN